MLSRTRASRAPDFSRIGNAISRPGIDPRVWVSLAIVRSVSVDPAEGVFVDVLLVPSELETTARLGAEYSGNGFGLYMPLLEGDEVLVTAPRGDPAEGLVVTRRLHSPSDPPPQEVTDHPEDVLLVMAPGKSCRVVVSAGGKILLGSADSTEQVPLGNVLVDALIELLTTGALHSPDGPVFVDQAWVLKYLTDPSTNILSQVALTERGGP